MIKRLNKELENLKKENKYSVIRYYWDVNDKPILLIEGPSISQSKSNVLKIIIPKYYPFEVPTVLYNDKPLPHYEENNKCTFCDSFLCPNNWSPRIRISQLLDYTFTILNIQLEKQMSREVGDNKLQVDELTSHIESFLCV